MKRITLLVVLLAAMLAMAGNVSAQFIADVFVTGEDGEASASYSKTGYATATIYWGISASVQIDEASTGSAEAETTLSRGGYEYGHLEVDTSSTYSVTQYDYSNMGGVGSFNIYLDVHIDPDPETDTWNNSWAASRLNAYYGSWQGWCPPATGSPYFYNLW